MKNLTLLIVSFDSFSTLTTVLKLLFVSLRKAYEKRREQSFLIPFALNFLFLYLATGARLPNSAIFFSALSILVGSPLSCSVINTMSSVARISLSRRHFLWPYTIYQSVDQTHQQSQCTFSAVSSLTNQMFV